MDRVVAVGNNRKHLGVMAAYIGHRPDILEFVGALRVHFDVSIYVLRSDAERYASLLSGYTLEVIDLPGQRTVRNKAANRLFDLIGKIPGSEYNYYMTKWTTTFSASYSIAERDKLQGRIELAKKLPKVLAYDRYLSMLDTSSVSTSGLDAFLSFTPVYNQVTWAAMLHAPIPCLQYVYSWDHACKFKDFSKRVDAYLTWDTDIADDLDKLQALEQVPKAVVGSTQFTFVRKSLDSDYTCDLPVDGPYVYFGCATGYPLLADSEVRQVEAIAHLLASELPGVTLVVRTYPFLEATDTYDGLMELPNVVLDRLQDYETIAATYEEATSRKLYVTQQAVAFAHFGTTLGVEAALLGVPSILCDFGEATVGKPLHDFVHQYQNDKYLNRPGTPSTAASARELVAHLHRAMGGGDGFPVNAETVDRHRLRRMDEIASDVAAVVSEHITRPART